VRRHSGGPFLFDSRSRRISQYSSVFLINAEGAVISHSSEADEEGVLFRNDVLQANTKETLAEGVWKKRQFGSERVLDRARKMGGFGWYLSSVSCRTRNSRFAAGQRQQMNSYMLFIALFSLPLAFAALLRRRAASLVLIGQMKKNVKQGDFAVRVQHDSKDEIGELARNFKSMVARGIPTARRQICARPGSQVDGAQGASGADQSPFSVQYA